MYLKSERAISTRQTHPLATLGGARQLFVARESPRVVLATTRTGQLGLALERTRERSREGLLAVRAASSIARLLAMKVIGYICCALTVACLTSVVRSGRLQDKEIERQYVDATETDETFKMKRPFCNAFTGCGRKRSFYGGSANTWDASERRENLRFPFSLYRALLRSTSQDIRDPLDEESNDYRLPETAQDYTVYPARKMSYARESRLN